MKTLLLLGSTGSIGTQTLDCVRADRGAFRVAGLVAGRSWETLLEQARELSPDVVALADAEAAEALRPHLPAGIALRSGPDAAEELAAELEYDLAMHGMVGAAGVLPSARVLERGRTLALANKESLVVAGDLLMELSRESGAALLPVDSEHAAIFQCLRGEDVGRVRKIYLTASGGPFRDLAAEELEGVTPAMALRHPNWDMGPRITVGSATLMNKALEVIEAHHLFGLPAERIGVVVHRQSIVHSMVEFCDGSVIAQMGPPDMRGPIHYALHHPDRKPADLVGFDPVLFRELTFEEPDLKRFPTLELGFRCVAEGEDSGAALNAADEVAVAAFLAGEVSFQEIPRINRRVLESRPGLAHDIPALLESDRRSRALAEAEVQRALRPEASPS
ncbi:MAG: 1-deoxy-D-xylulose-5-phosphate reductoisomerase [Planctomycetota bacterium]